MQSIGQSSNVGDDFTRVYEAETLLGEVRGKVGADLAFESYACCRSGCGYLELKIRYRSCEAYCNVEEFLLHIRLCHLVLAEGQGRTSDLMIEFPCVRIKSLAMLTCHQGQLANRFQDR